MITGILLAGVAFIAGSRVSGSEEPQAVVDSPVVPQSQPAGNPAIGVYGGEGALEHLLVVLSEDEGGYSVVTVPARTIVETPDGFIRLDRLAESGDRQQLTDALASLLQVTIQHFVGMDRQTLEAAAERADIINFSTGTSVSDSDGTVVLEVGDNLKSPSTAVGYLDASLEDPASGSTLQALFFKGLRDAISTLEDQDRRQVAAKLAVDMETDLSEEQVSGIIIGLSDPEQPFGLWALPVNAAGSGDDWYYEPVLPQVQALMQGSNLAQAFNLTVENGTETQGLVEAAGAKLAPLRYNINLNTATSEVNYDHTQIRCGSDALQECERVVEALGAGTIIKDEYLDSKQIVVIIGVDMAPSAT